jgi:hypothetical protein
MGKAGAEDEDEDEDENEDLEVEASILKPKKGFLSRRRLEKPSLDYARMLHTFMATMMRNRRSAQPQQRLRSEA